MLSLPLEQAKIIYYSCYFNLIPTFFSIYTKTQIEIALISGGVFITSVNYWSYPIKHHWRRYLDIFYVHSSFLYALYLVHKTKFALQYYSLCTMPILCYPISVYYGNKKMYVHAAVLHSLIHVFASICNLFFLYMVQRVKKPNQLKDIF